jgi:ribosomal protein S18 acetylase RimI-like enzyme
MDLSHGISWQYGQWGKLKTYAKELILETKIVQDNPKYQEYYIFWLEHADNGQQPKTKQNTSLISVLFLDVPTSPKKTVMTMWNVYTAPTYRQKGHIKYLIGLAFDKMKKRGITECDLFVEADNLVAMAMYLRMGFQDKGSSYLTDGRKIFKYSKLL